MKKKGATWQRPREKQEPSTVMRYAIRLYILLLVVVFGFGFYFKFTHSASSAFVHGRGIPAQMTIYNADMFFMIGGFLLLFGICLWWGAKRR
ncbi:MAG TPA: hypothetical protein VHL57_06340 [Flavobacteriales bacterium]|nr:hypothetical protein [Flavobacteriales bacterium]